MRTGHLPFSGTTAVEMAAARLHAAPVPPRVRAPGIEPTWESVILKCLERDPNNRFATVAEVEGALLDGTITLPRAPRGRRRALLSTAAVLGTTALALLAVRARRTPPEAPIVAAPVERPMSSGVSPTAAAPQVPDARTAELPPPEPTATGRRARSGSRAASRPTARPASPEPGAPDAGVVGGRGRPILEL